MYKDQVLPADLRNYSSFFVGWTSTKKGTKACCGGNMLRCLGRGGGAEARIQSRQRVVAIPTQFSTAAHFITRQKSDFKRLKRQFNGTNSFKNTHNHLKSVSVYYAPRDRWAHDTRNFPLRKNIFVEKVVLTQFLLVLCNFPEELWWKRNRKPNSLILGANQ